jgi:hypothetical protein
MRAWLLALMACAGAGAKHEPVTWSPPIDIASGAAHKGPWRQNESQFDYVDDPTVAIDGRGTLVAWVDQAAKDIRIQRVDASGQRSVTMDVSNTPQVFSWLPRIVCSPRDPHLVFVLWQEIVFSGGTHGGDIFFARSVDGGQKFERAHNLSRSPNGDGKARIDAQTWLNGSLDLVTDERGNLFAAWTDFEGNLWFTSSTNDGVSFAAPRAIASDPARPARAPSIAAANGIVNIAWTVGEDLQADIQVATSRDGGATFSPPIVAAVTEDYSDAPKLAVDRHGNLHLVQAEVRGGPFGVPQIYYTRSHDRGRTFEPTRKVSSPRPDAAVGAGFPMIAVDGDHVVVTWELYSMPQRPRGLAITVSRDGGTSFSKPEVIPGSRDPAGGINGSLQGQLMRKLAVRDGTVAVVNSAFRHGVRSRVWLVRGTLH